MLVRYRGDPEKSGSLLRSSRRGKEVSGANVSKGISSALDHHRRLPSYGTGIGGRSKAAWSMLPLDAFDMEGPGAKDDEGVSARLVAILLEKDSVLGCPEGGCGRGAGAGAGKDEDEAVGVRSLLRGDCKGEEDG